MMQAHIDALFVYPVKACRGIALPAARMTERGLEHDREWMIVDEQGRFVTQRTLPRLALVVPSLDAGALHLAAPGTEPHVVPLDVRGRTQPVTVWRDSFDATDQGDAVAAWLSTLFGVALRLVRFNPSVTRRCNPAFVGESGAHTGFADAYPVLLLAQASLDDLNARLEVPLPVNRFRPNVVLSGIDAYEEDHIDELATAGVVLKFVKPCTRCTVTTTDQATASVGVEPLPTLAGYRHNATLDGVVFGMNAIVTAGVGALFERGATASYTLNF
jgi:uncharacterized protein